MNKIVLEDNKRIRREIDRDNNLYEYRLTIKVPITFLGFSLGYRLVYFKYLYPVFEQDETTITQIVRYCEKQIFDQRSRKRQRNRNAINKLKAYGDTVRPDKTTSEETEKEN